MFSLFSWVHFLYVFVAIGLPVGLFFVLRNFKTNKEQMLAERILLGMALLFVILEYVGRIISLGDKFNFFDNLPLNAFQVFLFVGIYAHFSRKIGWIKFDYLIVLPMSILSLIFVPNFYTTVSAFSLPIISYVLSNSMLITYSLMSLVYTRHDIEHKDILNSVVTYIIIVAIAHIVNVFLRFTAWGLNADYFGTMAENYDILIGLISKLIPVPFVVMLPVFALSVGLSYLAKLPFDVIKSGREKREQLEEIIALGNLKEQQKYREDERANRKSKSQILVRSEEKAKPSTPKADKNINIKEGFVKANKDVAVDRTIIEGNDDKK